MFAKKRPLSVKRPFSFFLPFEVLFQLKAATSENVSHSKPKRFRKSLSQGGLQDVGWNISLIHSSLVSRLKASVGFCVWKGCKEAPKVISRY